MGRDTPEGGGFQLIGHVVVASVIALLSSYCAPAEPPPRSDTAFAALQERGESAMGVDQYASSHVFESLPDGGRIALQMKTADSTGTSAIRDHMRDIARAFGRGDFAIPGRVHAIPNVPGASAMSRLSAEISYAPRDIERGGEVRITSRNPDAVAAIHEFLAFQREDHHAH